MAAQGSRRRSAFRRARRDGIAFPGPASQTTFLHLLLVTRKCQAGRDLRRGYRPRPGGRGIKVTRENGRSSRGCGSLWKMSSGAPHSFHFAANLRHHLGQSHRFILQYFGCSSKRQGLVCILCVLKHNSQKIKCPVLNCTAGFVFTIVCTCVITPRRGRTFYHHAASPQAPFQSAGLSLPHSYPRKNFLVFIP